MITMKQRLIFWAVMLSYFLLGGCQWQSPGINLKINGIIPMMQGWWL